MRRIRRAVRASNGTPALGLTSNPTTPGPPVQPLTAPDTPEATNPDVQFWGLWEWTDPKETS